METDHLAQIIAWIKAGNLTEARQALRQRLQENPRDERAWLWLVETMSANTQRIAVLEQALKSIPDSELLRRGLARLKIQQFSQSAPGSESPRETSSDHTVRLSGTGGSAPPSTPEAKPATVQPIQSEEPSTSADSVETGLPPPEEAAAAMPVDEAKPTLPEPAQPAAPSQARRKPGASRLGLMLILALVIIILGIIAYVLWQRKLGSAQLTLVEATQVSLAGTQTAQLTGQAALEEEPPTPTTGLAITSTFTAEPEAASTSSPTSSPGGDSTATQAAPTAVGVPSAPWRLAFIAISIRDGVLNLWRNDRPAIFLADLGDATYTAWGISPDALVLIYLHQKDLWAINTDGSAQRPLLSFDQLQALEPLDPGTQRVMGQADWIPGTHQLLFTTLTEQGDGKLEMRNDLYRLDTDKGMTTMLLPPGEGGRFLVSPDATRLAFVDNDHLSLASINGEKQHDPFTWSSIPSQTETTFIPDVAWSPDSKSLLVIIPFSEAAITPNPTDYAIWKILMEGPEAMQVGSLPVGPGLRHVIFSPDNEFLAYQSPAPESSIAPSALHVATSNGTQVAAYPGALPMDETGQVFALWSTDGRQLLFAQGTDSGMVYMVAGPGMDPQPVLLNGTPLGQAQASRVGWLDGNTLYFHEANGPQMYWLDLATGGSDKLMLADELQPVIRLLKP